MKTVYLSTGEMEDTPAAIDRKTRTLYINPKLYFNLTPFQRKFVKLHEYGHLNLDTDIEEKADAYAFDKLAGTEFRSLKQCIGCLETILDPSKPGHKARIDALYERAIQWDKEHPITQTLDRAAGKSTEAEDTIADSQLLLAAIGGMQNQSQMAANVQQQENNARFITVCLIIVAAYLILDK